MLEFIGYICALAVGISLGALGMGGSILTIPVMVYFFGIDPVTATGYSLFIVGITSAAGGARYIRHRLVDGRTAVLFSLPSIVAVFLTRTLLMPALPDVLISTPSFRLSKNTFILLLFALLMVVIAYHMIRSSHPEEEKQAAGAGWSRHLWLALLGLLTGLLTGLLGAGGGFIIIPALVLLAKVPVRMSVGTSLLIIAVNSFIGFGGEMLVNHEKLDAGFLLLFSTISVAGIFIGFRWASRLASHRLKSLFGWFVLATGLIIFIREFFFNG
jgi:uncharacterized membrane protein YfcA